jgi:hypothetical protein
MTRVAERLIPLTLREPARRRPWGPGLTRMSGLEMPRANLAAGQHPADGRERATMTGHADLRAERDCMAVA